MASISTSDLTQASGVTTSTDGKYTVTGTGVFDDLMEAVNAHLDAQFNLGRLTGADYATVYLGAVQSSMQQSVAFILGKQQADKQADLIDKQILTEVKKTLDVTSTTTVRDAQSAKDLLVKAGQITSMTKEDVVKTNQALDVLSQTSVRNAQSVKDLLVKQEQIDMSVKQQATEEKKTLDVVSTTSVRDAQSAKDAVLKDAQTLDIHDQAVLRTQASDADLSIKRQQIINEAFTNGMEVNEYIWEIEYKLNLGETYTFVTIENLTDNDVVALMTADPHDPRYPEVNAVTLSMSKVIQHAGKSTAATIIAKTQEEVDLLKQKRITEHAQTLTETIGSTIVTSSVMGKQAELFTQQAVGFENDAKNAFNKNMADILKMQINTQGDFSSSKFITVEHLLDLYPDDDNVVAAT
jgi:hypothetical protein